MSDAVPWALIPVWLLLAVVVTIIVLLEFPNLYEKLSTGYTALKQVCTCACTCNFRFLPEASPDDDPTYRPAGDVIAPAEPVVNHHYDYSEIDMAKTHTFQPIIPQQKPRLRYEEHTLNDRDSHTYSSCGDETPEETKAPDRTSGPHCYAILEPGSNKRLMVKVVTEDVEDSPNHVYFKLEPGTKKVIPQFQVNLADIREKQADHTYFVLEPSSYTVDDENAYAVNDIIGHHFFILEETYGTLL